MRVNSCQKCTVNPHSVFHEVTTEQTTHGQDCSKSQVEFTSKSPGTWALCLLNTTLESNVVIFIMSHGLK